MIRIEDLNLQVDALLEAFSAKTKASNRAAIGHVIDTLWLKRQLDIPFRGHRDSGRIEPVSLIKDELYDLIRRALLELGT